MSPVVRVVARPDAPPPTPPVPWRVRLRLDELVLAARLAGDVPLPMHVDPADTHRFSDRLAGIERRLEAIDGERSSAEVRELRPKQGPSPAGG